MSAIQTACRHRRRCDAMYAPAHATNRNNQKPKEHNAKIIIMNTLKKKIPINLICYLTRAERPRETKKKKANNEKVLALSWVLIDFEETNRKFSVKYRPQEQADQISMHTNRNTYTHKWRRISYLYALFAVSFDQVECFLVLHGFGLQFGLAFERNLLYL